MVSSEIVGQYQATVQINRFSVFSSTGGIRLVLGECFGTPGQGGAPDHWRFAAALSVEDAEQLSLWLGQAVLAARRLGQRSAGKE